MTFAGATAQEGHMLTSSFCNVNGINHYLYDNFLTLQTSCTSTNVNEEVVFIVVALISRPQSSFLSFPFSPLEVNQTPSAPAALTSMPFLFGSGE